MRSKKVKAILISVFLLLAIGIATVLLLNTLLKNQSVKLYLLEHLSDFAGCQCQTAPRYPARCKKNETIIDDSFSQLPASDKWLYVDCLAVVLHVD